MGAPDVGVPVAFSRLGQGSADVVRVFCGVFDPVGLQVRVPLVLSQGVFRPRMKDSPGLMGE